MRKGLFVNNAKAQDSIHESGIMAYDCLRISTAYVIDYAEISAASPEIPLGYDFYFFNYHPATMAWVNTRKLRGIGAPVITMVLEVLPGDPFVMCPSQDFDAYCVLDPTIKHKNRKVFAFPRPLEKADKIATYEEPAIPVIGSFGFATRGKGFQHVVDAVNKEFDRAKVRINIPFGDFVPDSESYAQYLADICRQRAKPGIEVEVTHLFMSKPELIDWCAQNTLNCFLYDRNIPGLAATTDQAILTGRPLAVSDNETFRHITQYLPPYPAWSLKDSIEKSVPLVCEMCRAWQPEIFAKAFETVLVKLPPASQTSGGSFTIPAKTGSVPEKVVYYYRKYMRLLSISRLQKKIFSKKAKRIEEFI